MKYNQRASKLLEISLENNEKNANYKIYSLTEGKRNTGRPHNTRN